MELTAEEGRVIGVLLEKQRTTPADYPLTGNAVLRACNQSTSRDPVVAYDEATIDQALSSLRERGLTRIVYSPTNRAPKHRHVLDEALGLDAPELALLAVLLLRGPQTPAELRARSERLHRFDDHGQVMAGLDRLAGRDEPLVALLDRQAGRKEARWAQLLSSRPADRPDPAWLMPPAAGEVGDEPAGGRLGRSGGVDDRTALQDLQAQIDELRTRLDQLVAELGGGGDDERRRAGRVPMSARCGCDRRRARAGGALARALAGAGWQVHEPVRRGDDVSGAAQGVDLVVVATPDAVIAEVASAIEPGPAVVAHLAGSLGLDVLGGHARTAAIHPLVSLPSAELGAARLAAGAWFAVAGDPLAEQVVADLGGRWFDVADADRAVYHAAACIASNHLVALLGQVERVAAGIGVPIDAYLDLARDTVDNVARLGPAAALTGPVARGDQDTIERHLAALDPSEREAYRALAGAAGRLVEEGCTDEVPPHHRRVPRRAGRGAPRRTTRSASCRPWASCTTATCRSCGRRWPTATLPRRTIFVNPLQFGAGEDLASYPRDLDRDTALAGEAGVTHLFVPSVEEMYPEPVLTTVTWPGSPTPMEGASRPTHFAGVATVVAKLFSIAGPCRAYFGEKDYQQLAVVRRMVVRPVVAGRGGRLPDGARATTAWRCRAATCTSRPSSGPPRPCCTGR